MEHNFCMTPPGPDPKVVGTKQIVSWYCITCKPEDNVKIEVIENLLKVVYTTTGKNANAGSQVFELNSSWAAPGKVYNVKVSLQKNPKVFGITIKPFPVIPTIPTNINLPF
ncbi:hypothetical protein GLOIN_2v1873355 [Rhizophagus clarus]|uniref:Uncharacterized protein n=1 Tax=Rhizophagus clarus TaxID=94130 RepID=A0A8H3QPD1_9GLOM|nr:hypothetical protein GLOIN_2v1873355 [Rhizophagus clarus]